MSLRVDGVYGANEPCPCMSGQKVKRCCGKSFVKALEQGFTESVVVVVGMKRDGGEPSVGEIDGVTIVKIQAALSGGVVDPSGPVMVYDRARNPMFKRFIDYEAVADILRGRPKAYVYADIKYGQIVLHREAPAQPW